jgi:hypothetical protein
MRTAGWALVILTVLSPACGGRGTPEDPCGALVDDVRTAQTEARAKVSEASQYMGSTNGVDKEKADVLNEQANEKLTTADSLLRRVARRDCD